MQGRSEAFVAAIAAPVDHVERTAFLLEQMAVEVRRYGVVEGNLTRDRERDNTGQPTGVHNLSLSMRVDHGPARQLGDGPVWEFDRE